MVKFCPGNFLFTKRKCSLLYTGRWKTLSLNRGFLQEWSPVPIGFADVKAGRRKARWLVGPPAEWGSGPWDRHLLRWLYSRVPSLSKVQFTEITVKINKCDCIDNANSSGNLGWRWRGKWANIMDKGFSFFLLLIQKKKYNHYSKLEILTYQIYLVFQQIQEDFSKPNKS